MVLTQFDPSQIRDQTKRENIFMDFFKIFWLELQTWPNLYRLNKGIWLDWRKQLQKVQKRRAMCLVVIIWRRQSPNKRFTIRKCFLHPLVDYQLQVIFKTLDDPRWGPSLQKVQVKCHLSKSGNFFRSLAMVLPRPRK